VKQCFAISGIWQTPTLDDSEMSSRAVESILIYLERALMVLEIAGEQALGHIPMTSRIPTSSG